MRYIALCCALGLTMTNIFACSAVDRSRPPSVETSTESAAQSAMEREQIINRLIPEDTGLHPSRRSWLVQATLSVLGGDQEELMNINRLRATLNKASLKDLQRIEAAYKEKAAQADH